jgi:hypothetical protein
MQRRTLHIALDFFRVGAVIPLILLLLWSVFLEHAPTGVQDRFISLAFLLWPTGMQILAVPHPESSLGHVFTIAIFVIENAILYSMMALLVHWIVVRLRHVHLRHSH